MLKDIFGKHKHIFVFLIILLVGFSFIAHAETKKDSDFDGLSDESEIQIYETDPNNPDTDGDGVLDYQEVIDHTDPLDARFNRVSTAQPLNFGSEGYPLMWTIGKTAGVASFVMFTLVILMGLSMTSKVLIKYRYFSIPDVQDAHMLTATFLAFILLVVHFSSFIFDDYIQMKTSEIFVPFLFTRDVTSVTGFQLGTGVLIGVLAMYVSVLLLVTSHLKNRVISSKTWRALHYSSFLFYILFLVHAYTSGSDSNEPWLISIYIGSLILVIGMVLLRVFGKKYFLPQPRVKPEPAVVEGQDSDQGSKDDNTDQKKSKA